MSGARPDPGFMPADSNNLPKVDDYTCKHAIAFLAWLERKAAEPAPTSVQCYWETPALAKVATSTKVVKMNDLNEQLKVTIEEESISNFLSDAYAVLQDKAPQSIWVKSLSIPLSWGVHV
ncbi:unnamed protein product [Bemisia tabaci]|uniref:Uncharacterized protein n=1 Tax=Bemisia tabaci TaxID=7038 RepID=A0A9P0AE80_BEMTA|nr:unnamed protein product [Bemisia tabaci]